MTSEFAETIESHRRPPYCSGAILTHSIKTYPLLQGSCNLLAHTRRAIVFGDDRENERISVHCEENHLGVLFGQLIGDDGRNCRDEIAQRFDPTKSEGTFCFVRIEDSGRQTQCSIFSDPFGSQRIVYIERGGDLFFATSLSALSALLGTTTLEWDETAIRHYYHFGCTPSDRTLIAGIRKIPAGCELRYDGKGVSVLRYFSPSQLFHPAKFTGQSEEVLCQQLDEAITDSVIQRASCSDAVAVSLSGGVDSGYLAQALSLLDKKVVGYNLAYGHEYDEYDRVAFFASKQGIHVRRLQLSAEQILENFEHANMLASEPVCFNNATMAIVAKSARDEGIRCVFDGDGADRLFLGMTRIQNVLKAHDVYKALCRVRLSRVIAFLAGHGPSSNMRKMSHHFRNWQGGIPPYVERRLDGGRYNWERELEVYRDHIEDAHKEFQTDFWERRDDARLFFAFQGIRRCPEMFFYDLVELQSAIGTLPVSAYWSKRIVEFAISLPSEWKIRHGIAKYILKKAASRHLPDKYWQLRKIGLQDSCRFATRAGAGRLWKRRWLNVASESAPAAYLSRCLQPNSLDTRRLLPIAIWVATNPAAQRLLP